MNAPDLVATHAMLAGAMAENAPSPCISICLMDPQSGLCQGCLRTIDEIAHWSSMGEPQKRQVLAEVAQRGEALFQKTP